MLNSKLIALYNRFTKKDIKTLRKWVVSPCYNTDKAIAALHDYLAKHHGSYTESNISEAVLLKKIKIIKSANKLYQKCSALLVIAETYISSQNPTVRYFAKIELLKNYQYILLEKNYTQHFNKLQKEITDKKVKEPDDLYFEHLLTQTQYEGFMANTAHTAKDAIQPVTESLEIFYIAKKLRFLCEAYNRHLFIGTPAPENTAVFLQQVEKYNTEAQPYIYVFAKIYDLMRLSINAALIEKYHALKHFLKKYAIHFHPIDYKCIVGYVQNFCLKCINTQTPHFEKEFLYWHEEKFARKILLEENLISPQYFRSVVGLYVKMKDTAPAKKFIHEHDKYLPDEHKSFISAYCKAQIAYAEKNYENAQEILYNLHHNTNKFWEASARKLYIQAKWNLPKTNKTSVKNDVQNLKRFLEYNSEAIAVFYKPMLCFAENCLMILSENNTATINKKKAFAAQLQKPECNYIEKEWLLEKLKESLQPVSSN